MQEAILRSVAFTMADVFVFVVNFMNAREQRELQRLSKAVAQYAPKSTIFVIHNLRDVTTLADLEGNFNKIKRMYGVNLSVQEMDVMMQGGAQRIKFLNGVQLRDGTEGYCEHVNLQSHFVIARDGSDASYRNAAVFQYILTYVLSPNNGFATKQILDCIQDSFQKIIGAYAVGGTKISLDGIEWDHPEMKQHKLQLDSGSPAKLLERETAIFVPSNAASGQLRELETETYYYAYCDLPGGDYSTIQVVKRGMNRKTGAKIVVIKADRLGGTFPAEGAGYTYIRSTGRLGRRTQEITLEIPADCIVPKDMVRNEHCTILNGVLKLKFQRDNDN